MFKKVACLAVFCAAVASQSAYAAQDTGTIAVSATVAASCTIATNPLDFGTITSTNALDTEVSTTVDVDCTADSPFNIGIDAGANASGAQRRMASGANTMNYTVYVDGFGITEYGPISAYGNANNFNSPPTGNDGITTVTIYGVIPTQTTPASGAYSDTLTVTVNY